MVATMGRRRTPIKTQLWRNCMKDFYTKVSRADMRLRNGFCDRYCKNPADFPISYTYGGKAYRGRRGREDEQEVSGLEHGRDGDQGPAGRAEDQGGLH